MNRMVDKLDMVAVKVYGIGSSDEQQGLALSKQFRSVNVPYRMGDDQR